MASRCVHGTLPATPGRRNACFSLNAVFSDFGCRVVRLASVTPRGHGNGLPRSHCDHGCRLASLLAQVSSDPVMPPVFTVSAAAVIGALWFQRVWQFRPALGGGLKDDRLTMDIPIYSLSPPATQPALSWRSDHRGEHGGRGRASLSAATWPGQDEVRRYLAWRMVRRLPADGR